MQGKWSLRAPSSMMPLALTAVAALAVAAAQISFLHWVGHPFPQFMLITRSSFDPSQQWMVWAWTPYWWDGIDRAGLRASDVVLSINDEPVKPNYTTRFKAWAEQGLTEVSVVALRDEEMIRTRTPLAPLTFAQVVEFRLPSDILAWSLLALALVVYRTAPAKSLNRATAVTAALIACVFGVFYPALDFKGTALHARLLDLTWVLVASLVPAALFDLVMHFTGDAERFSRYSSVSRGLWVGCWGIALAYAVCKIVEWFIPDSSTRTALEIALFVSVALLLMPIVTYALIRLGWLAFAQQVSPRLRGQARIVLVGLALVSPVLLIHFSGVLVSKIELFVAALDLRYFYLTVPLAVVVAILRYQLFGLENRLLWLVALVVLSALAGNIAFAVMNTLGLTAESSGWVSPSALMIGVVLSGTAIGVGVMRLLRRALERRQIAYEGVYRFNEALAGEHTDLQTLPKRIVQLACDVLELDVVGIWLFANADASVLKQRALVSRIGAVDWPDVQPNDASLWEGAPRCWSTAQAPERWRLPHAWMVAPLFSQGQRLGVLVMGKRWDEEVLSRHDLEMGALVAQQCALVLLSAQQMQVLCAVPRQITLAQEQERARLARELHDTVQQALGRAPFYIEVARTWMGTDPKRADQTLRLVNEDLNDAARKLRQIRQELSAIQLDLSLEHTLRDLIRRFEQRSGVEAELMLPENLDAHLEAQTRYTAYRIVQQALDNIEAHARACRAWIRLQFEGEMLVLEIADDGQGFDEVRQRKAERSGHLGLTSMKWRAQAIGGELDIHSTPGAGARVVARLPRQPSAANAAQRKDNALVLSTLLADML